MADIDIYTLRVSKFPELINYVYIIYQRHSGDALVIDPAWDLSKIENLLRKIKANLLAVLLTHSHFDHVNLVNSLVQQYGCQIWMSETEIEYYNFCCPNLHSIDRYGEYGYTKWQIGAIPIETFFTPGHTKGSVCYLVQNNLFTGDTLFIEGCGICWGPGADPYEMYYSLRNLKKLIPSDTLVYPGHSYGKPPGLPFRYLLQDNIYLNIDDIDKFTKFRMRKNQRGLFAFK